MFSSAKLVWVTIGLFTCVVFLPGLLLESLIIPQQFMNVAIICCALFIAGILAGATLFPFAGPHNLEIDSSVIRRGLAWTIALQCVLTAYVFVAGPKSPLFGALTLDDAMDIALLREDAIKLNQDPVFVKIYSWARDIVGPVAFVLGVHALRFSKSGRIKLLALLGLLLSLALGLWSGQKATVLNYLLAAVIFSAASGWSMARQLAKVVPLLLIMAGVIFAITLPQYFSADVSADLSGDSMGALFEAVFHRILLSPLEVAAAYVYAIDELHIVGNFDVLPLATSLWTPGSFSIENTVALEFFYSGIDSASANALAFAYAYVLAGYVGCFCAGLLVVAVYNRCMWLVQCSGSKFMSAAFAALLSYQLLDLLNSNYLAYLITSILLAATFWFLGSLLRPRHADPGTQGLTTTPGVVNR